MKNLKDLDKYRFKHPTWPQTEKTGAFKVYVNGRSFIVLASVDDIGSDGLWEHISVTPKNQKRCPTWEEMSEIKDMFFDPDEEAIEYHPKRSRYVNFSQNCLHIWRPVNGKILRKPYEVAGIPTIEERDAEIEKLWGMLEDVPVDPDTEQLEDEFLHFPRGTDKLDIWHWFDERYSKGVHHLLYMDGTDRTDEVAEIYSLKEKCIDCDSECCIFNPQGVCKFPLVSGREPVMDDDGCHDFCYKDDDGVPDIPTVKPYAEKDSLLDFIKDEVPFRLREVLSLNEDDITDDLVKDCVKVLHEGSDVMFNYDSIDETLTAVCHAHGITELGD